MKTWRGKLFVPLAVVLLAQTATAARGSIKDEFVPGVRKIQALSAADTLFPNPPACEPGQLTVCVGCKTVKVCLGGDDALNPTPACPTATPYCNSKENTCSTVPDDAAECGSEFMCTGEGKFPNPSACDSYYYCEGPNVAGDAYVCPQGYTYNSAVKLCQRYGSTCPKATCTKNGPIFNPLGSNSAFFYYCKYDPEDADAPPEIIVFTCGGGALFDAKVGKCVFKCPRDGLFAKDGSPSSYYECYFDKGRLVSREQQCKMANQVFDKTKLTCVTNAN